MSIPAVQSSPFEAFTQGHSGSFRFYFHLHNYRIYCYLLHKTRKKALSKDLTQIVFIVLFKNQSKIRDSGHLLRFLYVLARLSFLLSRHGKVQPNDLDAELAGCGQDDPGIMDDPDIVRNETLLALQSAVQTLPPEKREVVELYFFQQLSVPSISERLNLDGKIVREHLSQSLQWIGDKISSFNSIERIPGNHAA
jgi:RNA polymerase sigma-70 factor (ECF subfamily)